VSRGGAAFNRRLAAFGTGKGRLQFALAKAMPYGLITKVVKARIRECRLRTGAGGKSSK